MSNNIDNILESLNYKKLFKYQIKEIWKALLNSNINSDKVLLYPQYEIRFSGEEKNIAYMPFHFGYKWDLEDCRITERVKDFILFGIDVRKIELDLSSEGIKKVLKHRLTNFFIFERLNTLAEDYPLFYDFCKTRLGIDDSESVTKANIEDFFNSESFNTIYVHFSDLVRDIWKIKEPLRTRLTGIPNNIIPIVYYSIPRNTCHYLSSVGNIYALTDSSKIKLDIRTLSGRRYTVRELDDFVRYGNSGSIGVSLPKDCIDNNKYED